MPNFTVRTINSTYSAQLELPNEPDADAAHTAGVRGALMIARDEVHAGRTAVAVELIVEDQGGRPVRRSVVSVSVAPLTTDALELRT